MELVEKTITEFYVSKPPFNEQVTLRVEDGYIVWGSCRYATIRFTDERIKAILSSAQELIDKGKAKLE